MFDVKIAVEKIPAGLEEYVVYAQDPQDPFEFPVELERFTNIHHAVNLVNALDPYTIVVDLDGGDYATIYEGEVMYREHTFHGLMKTIMLHISVDTTDANEEAHTLDADQPGAPGTVVGAGQFVVIAQDSVTICDNELEQRRVERALSDVGIPFATVTYEGLTQ